MHRELYRRQCCPIAPGACCRRPSKVMGNLEHAVACTGLDHGNRQRRMRLKKRAEFPQHRASVGTLGASDVLRHRFQVRENSHLIMPVVHGIGERCKDGCNFGGKTGGAVIADRSAAFRDFFSLFGDGDETVTRGGGPIEGTVGEYGNHLSQVL